MKVYLRTYKATTGETKKGRTYWLIAYVGGERIHVSLGTRDKRAADLIASDILRKAELKRAGIRDPFEEQGARSIADHLKDFEKTLRARGVVEPYVKDRMDCLTRFVAYANVKGLKDLTLPSASGWLTEVKATGVSARTVNRHYQALRQLGIWLTTTRRSPYDPFEALKPLNEAADRRHVRRALTPEEGRRLLEAARSRPLAMATKERIHAGVTDDERARLDRVGEARALVYLLALGTGLRKGELRRLRWCDLDLERGYLSVTAKSAKSRRAQGVPIGGPVVGALTAYRLPDAAVTDAVVPSRLFPTIRTFLADLAAARIERHDAEGRVVDFHALRTTFISWLAMTGAHPRSAQALARHGSIDLTMNVYTDMRLIDLKGTVERLPLPGPSTPGAPHEARATG